MALKTDSEVLVCLYCREDISEEIARYKRCGSSEKEFLRAGIIVKTGKDPENGDAAENMPPRKDACGLLLEKIAAAYAEKKFIAAAPKNEASDAIVSDTAAELLAGAENCERHSLAFLRGTVFPESDISLYPESYGIMKRYLAALFGEEKKRPKAKEFSDEGDPGEDAFEAESDGGAGTGNEEFESVPDDEIYAELFDVSAMSSGIAARSAKFGVLYAHIFIGYIFSHPEYKPDIAGLADDISLGIDCGDEILSKGLSYYRGKAALFDFDEKFLFDTIMTYSLYRIIYSEELK